MPNQLSWCCILPVTRMSLFSPVLNSIDNINSFPKQFISLYLETWDRLVIFFSVFLLVFFNQFCVYSTARPYDKTGHLNCTQLCSTPWWWSEIMENTKLPPSSPTSPTTGFSVPNAEKIDGFPRRSMRRARQRRSHSSSQFRYQSSQVELTPLPLLKGRCPSPAVQAHRL